jgi:large subunit ribosomal protein L24
MKPLVHKKAKRPRQAPVVRLPMPITKGDRVRVIRGDDKGAEGRVLHVYPKTGRVKVEGINIVKRHRAPTPTSEGGIVEMEAPVHHSNVMLLDPASGEPTRIRRRKDGDGRLERLSVRSGQPIARER